jgi:Tat protein secretion system quality control protein TatD with DNase activity
MATRSPAPLSAARPTCFTASSTHRAADAVARLIPHDPILSETDHRTLTRAGGFLLSEEPTPAGRCACGQEQEGT